MNQVLTGTPLQCLTHTHTHTHVQRVTSPLELSYTHTHTHAESAQSSSQNNFDRFRIGGRQMCATNNHCGQFSLTSFSWHETRMIYTHTHTQKKNYKRFRSSQAGRLKMQNPVDDSNYGARRGSLGCGTDCCLVSCMFGSLHQSADELTTCDLLLLGLPFQISGRLQKCIDAHCA